MVLQCVHFGYGTPSELSPRLIVVLLDHDSRTLDVTPVALKGFLAAFLALRGRCGSLLECRKGKVCGAGAECEPRLGQSCWVEQFAGQFAAHVPV